MGLMHGFPFNSKLFFQLVLPTLTFFQDMTNPPKPRKFRFYKPVLLPSVKLPICVSFQARLRDFIVCVSLFALVRKPGRDHQKLYLWYETTFLSGLAYLCVVPDGAWTWTRHLSLWTMNQKIRSRKSKYTISNVVSEEATGNFGWHHEFFFGAYDRN